MKHERFAAASPSSILTETSQCRHGESIIETMISCPSQFTPPEFHNTVAINMNKAGGVLSRCPCDAWHIVAHFVVHRHGLRCPAQTS
jgi:hypothetical protein